MQVDSNIPTRSTSRQFTHVQRVTLSCGHLQPAGLPLIRVRGKSCASCVSSSTRHDTNGSAGGLRGHRPRRWPSVGLGPAQGKRLLAADVASGNRPALLRVLRRDKKLGAPIGPNLETFGGGVENDLHSVCYEYLPPGGGEV
jgi:hypothetical protein